jgi:hypothetical protein
VSLWYYLQRYNADQDDRVYLELAYSDFGQAVKNNSAMYLALYTPGALLPVSPYISLYPTIRSQLSSLV